MIFKNVLGKINHTFFDVNFHFLGSSGTSTLSVQANTAFSSLNQDVFYPILFLSWVSLEFVI